MSYRHDRKTPKTCKQCSAVYLQRLVSQQADLLKVDKENRVSTCNQILYKMILIKYYSNYTLNFTKLIIKTASINLTFVKLCH